MERNWSWIGAVSGVLLAVVAAVLAYNVGVEHGLTAQGATGAAANGYYRWQRAGIGPLFLLLFFWIAFTRVGCWGRPHRRWRYDDTPYDDPRTFDEWHRRAHAHMKEDGPADHPGSRG